MNVADDPAFDKDHPERYQWSRLPDSPIKRMAIETIEMAQQQKKTPQRIASLRVSLRRLARLVDSVS